MNRIKEYITNPATWIWFIVFVFWLGMSYATLNSRISVIEEKQEEFNVIQIQTQLAEINKNIAGIQKDIERLKMNR